VIREAFAPRFNEWHEKRFEQPVTIQWIQKGTIECYRYILQVHDRSSYGESERADVFFGGGVAIHQDVANRGYAKSIELPKEILDQIPKELQGQPLYAQDGSWYGTALNGLGIMYNVKACDARGLPVPVTWSDLAAPGYQGALVVADPSKSGSSAQCLVMVLLTHGWEKGFEIMAGILANTGGMVSSSSTIGPTVESGLAVAGFEPEFVAKMMIADRPAMLGYVNPKSATAISPDPITVLLSGRNQETARRFVEFVLSEEGQGLWALKSEDGGPAGRPLYRNPIRPDIYEKYGDKLVVDYNPFTSDDQFVIDMPKLEAYTALIPFLVNAMCGDNHFALQKAWRVVTAQGEGNAGQKKLIAPPFDEETALKFAAQCLKDQARGFELQEEWSKLFRERYDEVTRQQTASR
jgi:ABC-type Fe3+ transport system substrate-binding protein